MCIEATILIRANSMRLICTSDTSYYPAVSLRRNGYQQAIVEVPILWFFMNTASRLIVIEHRFMFYIVSK